MYTMDQASARFEERFPELRWCLSVAERDKSLVCMALST
jgi:hypothetical protein